MSTYDDLLRSLLVERFAKPQPGAPPREQVTALVHDLRKEQPKAPSHNRPRRTT